MGEAMFYLIANYKTEEKAKEAKAKANTVLKDLADFEDDWQTIRTNQHKPVKERHDELLRRHPLVSEFIPLPIAKENDSAMNYLAGNCEMEEDYSLTRMGATIMLKCEVWHFADWDNIATFFYQQGAKQVQWNSLNE